MRRIVPKTEFYEKQVRRHYERTRTGRSVSFGNALRRVTSMVLCLCMIAVMMCNSVSWVSSSALDPEATANAMKRIADGDTSDTYIGQLLSENWGSRYAGRIWTDKSVFASGNNINLDTDTDGYTGTVKFNSDFGTIFSSLASTQVINEYPPSPVDLVILLDMSGSMATDVVDGQAHSDYDAQNSKRVTHSRIYKVLESINKSIQEVMDISEYSRVAVIGYGGTAHTLLELGHYNSTKTPGKYLEVKDFRLYYGLTNREQAPNNSGGASYMVGTVDGLEKLNYTISGYEKYSSHARNDYRSSRFTCDPTDTLNIGYHTDMQAGIYKGFEELYDSYDKEGVTVTYTSKSGNEIVVQRIPVAIVMTDGGSNYALKPETGNATGNEWHNVPIPKKSVSSYSGAWKKYHTESSEGSDVLGNGKATYIRGGDATIFDILLTASYEKSKVQKSMPSLCRML